MKTLALFVVACLGLLALIVWQLKPTSRETVFESESPARKTLPTDDTDAPAHDELEEPGEKQLVSPAAPIPQSAPVEPQVAPTTRSAVHWASDDAQRQAKERFIELRDTLVDDPHNEAVLETALELARRLKWHNEARDLLVRLVRLRGDDLALRFELATQLMRLERWLEAIPQLRSIVEAQPGNARAWYNLAIAHQALGHLRDARLTWTRVLELMPENPDAHAHRGEVLLDLRAWDQAVADFETSLHLEPGSLDTAMNLSLALTKLDQLVEARDTLLPLLDQHPNHVPLLNRLAEITWMLYEQNPATNQAMAKETLDYCTRSLAVNSNQPKINSLRDRALQAAN